MMQRLYRSRHDRVIAGVCGGLADYFRVDVTIIRLIWAVAVFAAGTGILAYILAILIIPEEPYGYNGATNTGGPGTGESGTGGQPSGPAGAGPTTGSSASAPASAGHQAERRPHSTGNPSAVFGWILLGLGLVFLVRNFFPWLHWGWFWPLALVAFGLVIVFNSVRGDHR